MGERLRRWLASRPARLVALLVVALLAVWLRAVVDGRGELRRAQAAQSEGDLVAAVQHYGRAARWRAPGTKHVERSLDALESIGNQSELAGDRPLALAAHRERRRAVLGTRTFAGVEHPRHLEAANEAIARLMQADGYDGGRATEELSASLPGPTLGTFLAALVFVAWLGLIVALLLRGIDERGRWRRPLAVRLGFAALVLTPLWMWLTARG